MTGKQAQLVGLWFAIGAVLALGSLVQADTMLWIIAPLLVFASLNKDKLVALQGKVTPPADILERSPFWKWIAIFYTVTLVIAVVYHFAVDRLLIFEDPPFFAMFLGLLGPILGPLVIGQIETFRSLAGDMDE